MSLIALMVVWFSIEKLKFVVFKFVNFDWTCDDGDDNGVDDGIAVDVEVFTVALGRHSGSTFHRRGLSGAAVG